MVSQILLRVRTEIKNILKDAAKARGLTLNALIAQILWDWIEARKMA